MCALYRVCAPLSRTTNTGQWACLTTESETPPISALLRAPSPLLPITIVPASSSSLSLTIYVWMEDGQEANTIYCGGA